MFFNFRNFRLGQLVLTLALLGGLLDAAPIETVHAATLIVTNTNDSGAGSLRQAIVDAAAGDTITFDPSLAGQTIALTSQLTISRNLTIDGSRLASPLTLSGGDTTRIIQILYLAQVTISDLAFTRGFSTTGGAIDLNGNTQLILKNSTFYQNRSSSIGGAIAVRSISSMTVINSVFDQNLTAGTGGAIYIEHSPTTIIDSTFVGNRAMEDGGAISAFQLMIKNTAIYLNQAPTGGAILIEGNAQGIIVNSTITQNQAITSGGAIYTQGNGEVEVLNSTFAGNSAPEGSEVSTIENIHLSLSNTILACIPGNNGCIFQSGRSYVSNQNSMIASGTLQSFGLSELADHGGSTKTMALLPGSPLIDAGDDSVCATSDVNNLDQRGVVRPQGSHCDIGAFEYEPIRYVKWDARGANNGTSWTNAYTDLQSALAVGSKGDEIWVAAGTYKPGMERDSTFVLKDGVKLFGGFAGTETARQQRDPSVHITILSGDLGANDNSVIRFDEPTRAENVFHVVSMGSVGDTTILDGFTITGGNANLGDYGAPTTRGGGIWSGYGNPVLTNLLFTRNSAIDAGGGIFITNGSPTLMDITFTNNSAGGGGGLVNYQSNSLLKNILFTNNHADHMGGGAINAGGSHATFTGVTFSGNSSADRGGGLGNVTSDSTITDATFYDNHAVEGGGIYNSYANPTLTNVTLANNSTENGGSGIRNEGSSPTIIHSTIANNYDGIKSDEASHPVIRNSIIWGNIYPPLGTIISIFGSAEVSDSVIQNGFPNGTNIITTDPMLGALGNYGGNTQTIPLLAGSSAIDQANATYCPGTDQRGVARPQGSHCDIGAFEYVSPATPTPTDMPTDTSTPTPTGTPTATQTPTATATSTATPTATATETLTATPTLSIQPAQVNVYIGGDLKGNYTLGSKESTRQSYKDVNNGVVKIESTNNIPLIGAERVIYKVNNLNTSFTEMMALPNSQLDSIYWLPWYNNVDLDTQLRFGNVSTNTAHVHVYIGTDELTGSPFTLGIGESKRVSFAGINNGPVKIESDHGVLIVAAERAIYKVNGVNTSFSEMMALPNSQLNTTYWLPWYNNVDLDTQLRFGNVSSNIAHVHVYIGTNEMRGSPFTLGIGESKRVSFAGINNGPVKIQSDHGVPIVAAERVIYKVNGTQTSFTETMALPNSQLNTTFWLPWYNNVDLDTQLRIGNVSGSTATVHVFIGGTEVTPVSGIILLKGASTRVSYVGVNNGPVKIQSDHGVPIVAAERVIYKINGVNTSFSEMMALPNSQLNTTYWLPWYNNVDLDTQLRFGVP